MAKIEDRKRDDSTKLETGNGSISDTSDGKAVKAGLISRIVSFFGASQIELAGATMPRVGTKDSTRHHGPSAAYPEQCREDMDFYKDRLATVKTGRAYLPGLVADERQSEVVGKPTLICHLSKCHGRSIPEDTIIAGKSPLKCYDNVTVYYDSRSSDTPFAPDGLLAEYGIDSKSLKYNSGSHTRYAALWIEQVITREGSFADIKVQLSINGGIYIFEGEPRKTILERLGIPQQLTLPEEVVCLTQAPQLAMIVLDHGQDPYNGHSAVAVPQLVFKFEAQRALVALTAEALKKGIISGPADLGLAATNMTK